MGHIPVLSSEPGLPGVVARLVAGRHTVTEQTNATGRVEVPSASAHVDAIVCATPDPRATYDALSTADAPYGPKIIFVVTSDSAASIEGLPNPRLVKPFPLGELTRAIEAMMAQGAGPPPRP
jgi:hypothetical protein